MVKHIVMWNLRQDAPTDAASQMKEQLEALVGIVPGLVSAQVGRGFNGFDVALVSELENPEALDIYQEHPAHCKVKAYVHSVVRERACCDFIV